MAPPRAVADTNVWVAAAIGPNGVCGRLLRLALESRRTPVVSPLLIEELRSVLGRPKFRRWLGLDEASRFVSDLVATTEKIEDPGTGPSLPSPDPNDDFLLVLAEVAEVEALVSGDNQLLQSRSMPPVVSPAEFLRRVEEDSG